MNKILKDKLQDKEFQFLSNQFSLIFNLNVTLGKKKKDLNKH